MSDQNWVERYEALEKQLSAMATENTALRNAIKDIIDSAEEAEYDGYFSFVVNPDAVHAGADLIEAGTPATDAWSAEMQAQGVESFALIYAEEAIKSNNITTGWRARASRAASEYAGKLREAKA